MEDFEQPGSGPARTEVPCATCGAAASGAPLNFVYAIGRIEPRFPRLCIEKELAQVAGASKTAGLTDREVLHKVLSAKENRYLVRQLCWVLTIEGLETYLVRPHDLEGYDLLVDALRPVPRATDIDVIIGMRGPIAPPELCNGLTVPIVFIDQMYSFDIDALVKSLPRPKDTSEKDFAKSAEELFNRIMQMADNVGSGDESRALNYLVVRYPAIYAKAAEQFARDFSLSRVEVRPSPLSTTRKIVDVVFSFASRTSDFAEKFFVRVDVTEEFPFLFTRLAPYYEV
jgi:hypothetical protein